MAIRFNADEIFEIAEKIEQNGVSFYRSAAEMFKGKKEADLFNQLASMEEQHRLIFAAMRSEATKLKDMEDALYDPDNDTQKYLHAIADGKVFVSGDDKSVSFSGRETKSEILKTAIGLEKDSIIFYLGMRDMVPEKLGRSKMDEIINEEKRHIVILSEMF